MRDQEGPLPKPHLLFQLRSSPYHVYHDANEHVPQACAAPTRTCALHGDVNILRLKVAFTKGWSKGWWEIRILPRPVLAMSREHYSLVLLESKQRKLCVLRPGNISVREPA